MSMRAFCNQYIIDHPNVLIRQDGNLTTVSMLGLLNGFFGIREDGMGPICVEMEKEKIIQFKKTPIGPWKETGEDATKI